MTSPPSVICPLAFLSRVFPSAGRYLLANSPDSVVQRVVVILCLFSFPSRMLGELWRLVRVSESSLSRLPSCGAAVEHLSLVASANGRCTSSASMVVVVW